ncbi:unnamed protein product [Closterium sp. Naga37s-1]|nr:unnamed protein product [Closterium sp. Naga37s-1]
MQQPVCLCSRHRHKRGHIAVCSPRERLTHPQKISRQLIHPITGMNPTAPPPITDQPPPPPASLSRLPSSLCRTLSHWLIISPEFPLSPLEYRLALVCCPFPLSHRPAPTFILSFPPHSPAFPSPLHSPPLPSPPHSPPLPSPSWPLPSPPSPLAPPPAL